MAKVKVVIKIERVMDTDDMSLPEFQEAIQEEVSDALCIGDKDVLTVTVQKIVDKKK